MSVIVAGILAIAAGLLLPMGYPPFHFYPGSLLAFFPLLWALRYLKSRRASFAVAMLAGLVATGIGNYWMLSFGEWMGPRWAFAFYAMVSAEQSLFFGLFGLGFALIRRRFSPFTALLAAPLLFTLCEYLSSFGLFSQEILGHAHLFDPILRSGAALLGVNYLSFLSVGVSLAIFLLLVERDADWEPRMAVAGVVAVLLIANPIARKLLQPSPEAKDEFSVALVQAAFAPAQINDLTNQEFIYGAYLKATDDVLKMNPDLIVWPESLFPSAIQQMGRWRYRLDSLLESYPGSLLFAAPESADGRSYSEALIYFKGEVRGTYQKQILFPYGEAFPRYSLLKAFRDRLPAKLQRDLFSPGTKTSPLDSPAGRFGVMICLESLYGDIARKEVANGAGALVNLTNDAWFPSPLAAEKHFWAGGMRALENGRYFIQSALWGVSGVIDPSGTTVIRTGPGDPQTLRATAYRMHGQTLYTRLGYWRFLILGLISVVYRIVWRIGA